MPESQGSTPLQGIIYTSYLEFFTRGFPAYPAISMSASIESWLFTAHLGMLLDLPTAGSSLHPEFLWRAPVNFLPPSLLVLSTSLFSGTRDVLNLSCLFLAWVTVSRFSTAFVPLFNTADRYWCYMMYLFSSLSSLRQRHCRFHWGRKIVVLLLIKSVWSGQLWGFGFVVFSFFCLFVLFFWERVSLYSLELST